MKHKGKKILSLLLAVLMLVGLAVPTGILAPTAKAAAGDPPAHGKSSADNGDGTYTIELTVTGDADDVSESDTHINVLIVYDESSSMTNRTGGNNTPTRADIAEDAIYGLASSGLAVSIRAGTMARSPITLTGIITTMVPTGLRPLTAPVLS